MTTQEPTNSSPRRAELADITGDPTLLAPDAEQLAIAQTVAAPPTSAHSITAVPAAARSTVLPRIEGDGADVRLIPEPKRRYEPVKLLGTGGMGEVLLVNDQDIARQVAVKRLRPEMDDPARLARFVDEIRTVGRLEHPNIVPIHDVGVDPEGRYFFVMKYVEGETLEAIIKKLAAGDPEAHRRYTVERRVEIFVSVLNALAYAHANGVVHRDLKPANVMVGRFGEVMLMDWGIAKPIASTRDLAAGADATLGEEQGDARGRMYATRVGSIIGTPAYMSPEQARGDNHTIDERSDLYSATVLLHELISLHHYLEGKASSETLIASVINEEITYGWLSAFHHAHRTKVPTEIVHVVEVGLAKKPAKRFQSAQQMASILQNVLEGRMDVQCHITMLKRMLRESARLLDTHPRLTALTLFSFVAAMLFTMVQIAWIVID